MESDTVLAVLSSAGVTVVLGALVQGWFNKKKLGADATEIITRAASGVVERLEAEIATKMTNYATLEGKYNGVLEAMDSLKAAFAAERESWRRVLQLHVAWDAIAIAKLGELDIDLPPAPPLMPPGRADLD